MTDRPTFEELFQRIEELEAEAALRKQEVESIRESEKEWRAVIENAPSFVTITDRDGTIRYVNRTVPGLSKKEVIGKNINEFVESEYRVQLKDALEQTFKTGKIGAFQVRGIGPHASTSWYEARHGPLKENGEVVAATFITADITKNKQAEEILREAHDKLEQRVEARTAELVKANEKLQNEIEERKRLEKALMQEEKLKTLGAIAAEVAHEIRNPLVSIGGFAQRLKQKFPDLRECDIILSESQRLEKILSRIRSYLEPVEIHPQECSINSIITDCVNLLSPETTKRQATCRLELTSGLPAAYADPEIVAQIFINLIRNATKAMDKGGELKIRSFETDRDIHIEFKNLAPDMKVEDPEALFMPFSEGGQSVGLPLCYRLLKDMGGVLSIAQEDEFTLFTVSLPKTAPE